jgi:hypothetical protein
MEMLDRDKDLIPYDRVGACICKECSNTELDYLNFFMLLLKLIEKFPYILVQKTSRGIEYIKHAK